MTKPKTLADFARLENEARRKRDGQESFYATPSVTGKADAKSLQKGTIMHKVARHVTRDWAFAIDIAKQANINRSYVNDYLNKLKQRGLVEQSAGKHVNPNTGAPSYKWRLAAGVTLD